MEEDNHENQDGNGTTESAQINSEEEESDQDEDESDSEEQDHDDDDQSTTRQEVGAEKTSCVAKVKLKSQVFDIAFHPSKDVFAAALITGSVKLFQIGKGESCDKLLTFDHHKKPCRAIEFTDDENNIISVSKDKSINILDMNSGSLTHAIKGAHSEPINTLKIINNNFFATGDDAGVVKLWDMRTYSAAAEFTENDDFISNMVLDKERRHLLCSSGDGTLSVFNMKSKKLVARSDQMDDELLSVAIVKNGKKVVCGGSEGTLHIFSWGDWGDISDRFPGQPLSIDALCPINDRLLCTGSMDGMIRLVHILPNKVIGTVGAHDGLPIESLELNHDNTLLGSCSHEEIKLWPIEDFCNQIDLDEVLTTKTKNRKRKLDQDENPSGFFDDL